MASTARASRYLVFPAGPSDAEALGRVHVTSWRETYRDLLPEPYLARMSETAHARRFRFGLLRPGPGDVTLAAEGPAGLVGYAQGGASRSRIDGEAEIHTLYVLRRAQGQGVGRELVQSSARAFLAAGFRTLMISVLRDNQPARRFYERIGGVADAPRLEAGPGPEGRVWEVAYRWPDLRALV